MAAEPILTPPIGKRADVNQRVAASGNSFGVFEWAGSGPADLHVHHSDDEAWHVLEGVLLFRFADREVAAEAGSTVFVPAGVAHSFQTAGAVPVRYLVVVTPRIRDLITELQQSHDRDAEPAIYRKYESELLR